VAAELKEKTSLEIGYGNSGVLPYRFWLNRTPEVEIKVGLEKDYTFFKVILTTTPADFSMLIQDDPFPVTRVEPDAGTRRATTSRSPAPPLSQAQKKKDADARTSAYLRNTDEAEEFFSRNFIVIQTKK
jgi:hypothetical protein